MTFEDPLSFSWSNWLDKLSLESLKGEAPFKKGVRILLKKEDGEGAKL